jgi:hypothetical protein
MCGLIKQEVDEMAWHLYKMLAEGKKQKVSIVPKSPCSIT